jgi:hypothetical protein
MRTPLQASLVFWYYCGPAERWSHQVIPAEAVAWTVSVIAIIALQRWWHWKREAYRARDAAFASFESIKNAVLRNDAA